MTVTDKFINTRLPAKLARKFKEIREAARIKPEDVVALTQRHSHAIPDWQIEDIVKRTSSRITKLKKDKKAVTEMVLDEKGRLYQKSRKDFYYKVNSRQRLLLLQTLTDEYVPTKDIYREIHCKSPESLYKLKSNMNRAIRHSCKIKEDLLDVERILGIRINPKYKMLLPDS